MKRVLDVQKLAPWAFILASFAALAAGMRASGRFWICECQKVYFWVSDTWSSNNSQHLFDPYSFSHIEHGVFFSIAVWSVAKKLSWQWRLAIVLAIESAWEVFENTSFVINRYRETTASLGYTGDTVVNAVGDVLITAVGFAIFERFGWKWAIFTVVLIELALLLIIRDGLFLNLLTLIFPVPAIVEWQVLSQ